MSEKNNKDPLKKPQLPPEADEKPGFLEGSSGDGERNSQGEKGEQANTKQVKDSVREILRKIPPQEPMKK